MFLIFFLITALVTSSENTIIEPEVKELIETCTHEKPSLQDASIITTKGEQSDDTEIQKFIALFTQDDEPTKEAEATTRTTVENCCEQNSIIITNAIEPSMLVYKHWTGTYSPEIFTITIDGTSVAQGEHYTVPAATSIVSIRYDYSFMGGMRTGAKIVSYRLHEQISTSRNLTFSWKESYKVLIDHATVIKEEVV